MAEVENDNNVVQKQKKKYTYLLIMFIKRGPRTGRPAYDFVPASWVYVSKKTGKLVVKFVPPPYVEESSALLHHLIETLSDPIIDWPEYNVQLKGGAESHEEAKLRLEELDAKEYAFTTDADETPTEKVSQIIHQLKQSKLKVSAATEAALRVPELNSDEDQDCLPKVPVNASSRQRSKPKSSRPTLLGNNGTSSVSHGDDQTENSKLKKLKKQQMAETTSNSKAFDRNANLKIPDSATKKKKNVPNVRSTIINSDKQTSTSQKYVDSLDENSNMGAESLPERFHSYNNSNAQVFVDNHTDSENASHNDNNRITNSVMNSSPESPRRSGFSENSYRQSTVFNQTKSSEPRSKKSDRQISTSFDEQKSKPKRSENKSTYQPTVVSKSKPNESKSKYAEHNNKDSKSGESRSKYDVTSGKCSAELLQKIYDDLQCLKVDVKEIRANQRREEEVRQLMKVESGIQEHFISKYNLSLPYSELEDFEKFNSDLSTDNEFREEFMKSLVKFFDRDLVASKTLTQILKKYLSRDLAMRHTAIKKMPGKFLLRDTAFYDCLLGVLTETHRDKGGKFISESTFSSILGTALGNAKDWNGKRCRKNLQSNMNDDEVSSG